jgi:hypothetical protein
LNPLHPRTICNKFDWIWQAGSGGEDFKNFQCMFIREGRSRSLNKLGTPSPKDNLCQVWLKLALWFWRRSWKCKSLQTNGQTTDSERSEKFTWTFSSGELIKKTN